MGAKEPRLFTRAEAERTLPLVRRVTHDLMVEFPAWRRAISRYELLVAALKADDEEPEGATELRAELEEHARRMDTYLAELDQIGCVFKGFEEGLVDFYSMRDDRLVFLCWRYGEQGITHWHDIDAGYSGRQPVDGDILTQVT